ncbi:MAG: hypothetical protein K6F15_01185 [Treponema sp.]|nr:hypothetical protein [Treponema sp.]
MNQAGDEPTNYHKDNGDYVFDLAGDTNWYGGLVLAADTYNVIINLNGYSLYIHKLYLGWVDASLNQNCNLIINGPGSITIDEWALATWGNSSSVSNQNSLTITGNAVYDLPSNGNNLFASGYDTSGGVNIDSAFVWDGSESSEWTDPDNWTGSAITQSLLEDSSAYVLKIPAATSYTNEPKITSSVKVGTLYLEDSTSTLTIDSSEDVEFCSALSNSGTITHSAAGGKVIFSNSSVSLGDYDSSGETSFTASSVSLTCGTVAFNDVSISGTMTTSSGFSVSGNWNNSGTFTASAGTCNFTGSSQTITGTNTWYNLAFAGTSAQTVEWGSGGSQSVSNSLTFKGLATLALTLQNDLSAKNIICNSDSASQITIDLNGYDITVTDSLIMNATSTATSGSNLALSGSGTVSCVTFDYPATGNHILDIGSNATLIVSKTIYGDMTASDSGYMSFTGSGTLKIPGSGANLNYGNSRKIGVKYGSNLTILASIAPSYYQAAFTGVKNYASDSTITLTLTRNGPGDGATVKFPYKVTFVDSGDTVTYGISPSDVGGNSTLQAENNFSVDSSNSTNAYAISYPSPTENLTAGDGFELTVYAPDGSGLVLGTVTWYYNIPTWIGETSSSWTESSNWSGVPTSLTDLTAMGDYSIIIGGGCANYPDISTGTISVKNLTVKYGGSFTVSGGSFSISEKLSLVGDYTFSATAITLSGGTLTVPAFEIDGFAELNINSEHNIGSSASFTCSSNYSGTKTINMASGASLSANTITLDSSTSLELSGAASLKAENISIPGNVECNSNLLTVDTSSASGKTTFGSASTESNGLKTGTKIKVIGSADFYGDNTFDELYVDNSSYASSASLRFEEGRSQQINNSDTSSVWFSGNSTANRLYLDSIDGSSVWYVTFGTSPSRDNFAYCSVNNSTSSNALSMRPASAKIIDGGNNTNWFATHDFIWTGLGLDGLWETLANWTDGDGNSVSVYPKYAEYGDSIEIATDSSGSDLDLSLFTSADTLELSEVTVNEGKNLNLAGKYIQAADTITINGKVSLYGNQTTSPLAFYQNDTASISWGDNSSIEYYGSVDGSDVLYVSESDSVKTYKSLILNKDSGSKTTFASALSATSITDTADNSVLFKGNVTSSSNLSFKGAVTFESSDTIAISAPNVTFEEGSSLTPPSGNLSFSGNLDLSKITYSAASGAIIFNGSSAQTLKAKSASDTVFYGFSNTNATSLTVTGDLTINGDVSNSGNIIFSGNTLTLSGTASQTFENTSCCTVNSISPSNTNGVNLTGNLTVSANFENTGTFTQSSGSVSFTGTSPVISGDNTFSEIVFDIAASSLSSQAVTFEAGKTQVFSSLKVLGTETSLISLSSSVEGSQWSLKCSTGNYSDVSVKYAVLKDSNNATMDASSNPVLLYAFLSTDSGNNSNWAFPGTEYTWTGSTSTDWQTSSNWSPASVPGYYTIVTVPASASNQPLLSDAVDLKSDSVSLDSLSYSSKINVESGASLDLASYNLTCGTLSNKGSLRLQGLSSQAITGSISNALADSSASYEGSSVEYYGSAIANFAASSSSVTNYSNLLINGNIILSENKTLTAEEAIIGSSAASLQGSSGSEVLTFSQTPLLIKTSAFTVNSPLIAENIIFYDGSVTANAAISAEKDLLLFGANYSSDDSITGLSGILAYNSSRAASQSYTGDLSAAPYTATLSVASGITISAGKNFYANGSSLTGSGEWYLKVPSNLVASNCFLEAYNTSVENSKVICSDGTSDGSKAQVAAENCTDSSSNSNWDFDAAEILEAYTLYDSLIYVKFSKAIRNTSSEIAAALSASNINLWSGSALIPYAKAYSDAACTNEISSTENVEELYLKTNYSWNTDASGTSAGESMSSNRSGEHQTSLPVIDIPASTSTSLHVLTDAYGRRIKNYGSAVNGSYYASATDKASPVLIALYTGQELHDEPTGTASSQEYYDSHNFLEFRYSEPVNIGDFLLADQTKANNVNVRVSSSFGEITNTSTGLNIAGLCSIESGALTCGSEGSESTTVHSLYRYFSLTGDSSARAYQSHAIRISIAGFVDSTSTVDGSEYLHWLGYIDSGTCPSGSVSVTANTGITDSAGNVLDTSGITAIPLPSISVSSSESGLYGSWDLYPPVFAPYVTSVEDEAYEDSFEIAGSYDSSEATVLNRMEFHVFDNDPSKISAMSESKWYTQQGWCSSSSIDTLYTDYSYAPDVIGGARPYAESSTRTSGGLRYSSLYDKAKYFKYSPGVESGTGVISFDNSKNIKTGKVVTNSIFFPANYDYKAKENYQKIKNYDDNLYFGIYFTSDAKLSLKQTFSVSFDGAACITDLAGNRMKSDDIRTIDSLDPKFLFTAAKVSGRELLFIVNKKLNIGTITVIPNDYPTSPKEEYDALEKMKESLRIVEITSEGSYSVSNDLMIDSSSSIRVSFQSEHFTGLILTLNRNVTFEDMQKYYLQVYAPFTSREPTTGIANAWVTFIQDLKGNYMPSMDARSLSDFAIGVVNPVYAYDNRQENSDGSSYTMNMYSDSSYAVHDWSASQKNYGTLLFGYDIYLNAVLAGCNSESESYPASVSIYLDNKPKEESVCAEFNKIASAINWEKWRIWLPEKTTNNEEVFLNDFLAEKNNDMDTGLSYNLENGKNSSFTFKIPANDMCGQDKKSGAGWKAGDQISFIFSLFDENGDSLKVYHSPQYNSVTDSYFMYGHPYFSARLKKENDLTSLDLWSFRLKDIKNQRGGVTILNNVINASVGEQATVKVEMSERGPLNVVVMTLDGNVVQYLQHGTVSQGEHFYNWNGTTKSGKEVARGLYFVRVFGSGIDETRKIMVVKE